MSPPLLDREEGSVIGLIIGALLGPVVLIALTFLPAFFPSDTFPQLVLVLGFAPLGYCFLGIIFSLVFGAIGSFIGLIIFHKKRIKS